MCVCICTCIHIWMLVSWRFAHIPHDLVTYTLACTYTRTHTHTQTHSHIPTYIFAYIHALRKCSLNAWTPCVQNTHEYKPMYIYNQISVYDKQTVHTYMHRHMIPTDFCHILRNSHTYTPVRIRAIIINTHTHAHTYTHTCIKTHTYIHTHAS
jgi:hypothetical protein